MSRSLKKFISGVAIELDTCRKDKSNVTGRGILSRIQISATSCSCGVASRGPQYKQYSTAGRQCLPVYSGTVLVV